jgi:putative transposase
MANTYSQIHIHAVFAVKNREALIQKEWDKRLFAYIGQIINNLEHKTLIVNGVSDHVHIFFGLRPKMSVSEVLQKVKANSSKWVNESGLLQHHFEWQEGYGAFSHSKSQVDAVIKYIEKQEQHHQKVTFREEYLNMLEKFGVEFDEKYIFKDPM